MGEQRKHFVNRLPLLQDSAFEEEPVRTKPSEYVYTGRVKRRIVLVVDCLAPHDFDDKSNSFINLQQYVIREKNLSETKALLVFYEIIKIVENLHKVSRLACPICVYACSCHFMRTYFSEAL